MTYNECTTPKARIMREQMKRREVTDEMARRAQTELQQPKWTNRWGTPEAMRAALEAALNPPAEPEIEVSEMMVNVGVNAYFFSTKNHDFDGDLRPILPDIYRAMERARREEAGTGHSDHHVHFRKTAPCVYVKHRRSTDKSPSSNPVYPGLKYPWE